MISAAVLLVLCVLSACAGRERVNVEGSARIVGRWVCEDGGIERIYAFESDCTGHSEAGGFSFAFTYEINGDEITITADTTPMWETQLELSMVEMLDSGMLKDPADLIITQTGIIGADFIVIEASKYTRVG